MLSFHKSDFLVAIVEGGEYDKRCIYYHDNVNNKNINNVDLFDILNEDEVRELKKKMPLKYINELKKAIKTNIEPKDEELKYIYNILKTKKNNTEIKKIKIQDEGVIIPIIKMDRTDDETVNHQMINGPTGSGKSFVVGRYLSYIIKYRKDKNIYLFSDVEHDKALDKHKKIKRIILNNELYENPIKPEELYNSVCIFDDIDSISDKKIKSAVETLRDSLLKTGRHYGPIEVISTQHLMTDYKNTRVTLSESSLITFFIKSGSTNGINYLLKKYIGLNNKQISDIYALPSRSVSVYKNYPQMVISDKEIYIL
jgi:hypothetical protein